VDKDVLVRRVSELGGRQAWNHNISLPFGVETRPGKQVSHGKNLVKWGRVEPLLREYGLRGRRVLDLGCNEGFFSFKAAESGAEVTGVDIDPLRIEKAQFAQQALGADGVSFRVVDIYSEEFSALPEFDLCICMGFLHRIPDPASAVARIAIKARAVLFEWKCLKFGPHDEPFAYFTPAGDSGVPRHETQYWLLSIASLKAILRMNGFDHFHVIDDPRSRRAILLAGSGPNPAFDLPDQIGRRPRWRILASHTKRYLRTVWGVLDGRINA
jgi:tRNA (mo5U34)-methyltransferase